MQSDSVATQPLEEYRTQSGRIIYGGGGITPDLIVEPERLNEREMEFAREVQKHGSKYRDVLYSFAIQYAHDQRSLQPGFAVSPRCSTDSTALVENGIEIDRSLDDAASRWVGENPAYEITLAKWNRELAQQRANAEDRQVKVAADLLREATSPQSLFAAASRYSSKQSPAAEAGSRSGLEPVSSSPH